MKYIKYFESEIERFEEGDTVYCIDNNGIQDMEIGDKLTVGHVDNRYPEMPIYTIVELGSRWQGFRFSKNPKHRNILAFKANKATKQFDL